MTDNSDTIHYSVHTHAHRVLTHALTQALTPAVIPETSSLVSKVLSSRVSKVRVEDYENIIIIDSTWQEARKIFNHSAYLKNAPQFTLKTSNDSLYTLRANQPKGGLCTIECIIEVLRMKGQEKMAADLSLKFELFNG